LLNKKLCFKYSEKGQDYFIHYAYYSQVKESILHSLEIFHQKNPTRRGVSKTELKVLIKLPVDVVFFNNVLNELVQDGSIAITDNRVSLSTHQLQLTERQQKLMDKIATLYFEKGFTTPDLISIAEQSDIKESEANEILNILFETGALIKAEGGIIFHQKRVDEAMRLIKAHFNQQHHLTVADFRGMIASSRKYAVPLLNYFDSLGLTIRQQDVRVINPDFKTETGQARTKEK